MTTKARKLNHMWKIIILNPLTNEPIDEDIVERLNETKYINQMNISESKLRNIYSGHTGKRGYIRVEKIKT